jgi:hypothetical protein
MNCCMEQVTEAAHAGLRTHAEQRFARESASRLAMKFGMSVRMEEVPEALSAASIARLLLDE